MALTPEDLIGWGDLKTVAPTDGPLRLVVAATNAYVNSLPVVANTTDKAWTDAVTLGAMMLGYKMYRRRNSPGGIESITDAGVAYVARTDPDVTRLLQLDAPAVG